ncbi:hypothetical protein WJU16_05475 [Chitinophaga pollutisoli]|uniref:Uncharacterized protein n=1 Tax=Chitinophaga pollutisoli TaxID=3133966 RepID=A0ABZ2YRR4_9BACT
MPREDAENAWKTQIKGQEYLFITKASLLFYPDYILARQPEDPSLNIRAFPKFPGVKVGLPAGKPGIFQTYTARLSNFNVDNILKATSDSTAEIALHGKWPAFVSDVFIATHFQGNMAAAKKMMW